MNLSDSSDGSPAARRDVVCIVGPTGSGKSRLALQIAQSLNGEIVNCDSLQLYRGFDLGTAKPTPTEQNLVPHHLLDVAGPGIDLSAGDFARLAIPLLHTISDRKRLPVVAGGTGFYLKALMDGLVAAPARHPALRQRLLAMESRSSGRLHRLLRRWDPPSARRIQPNDVQKLVRALECIVVENRPLSSLYQQPREAPQEFRFFQIGLNPPRDWLYRRLDARCQSMWDAGLLEETSRLLDAGYSPDAKPFGSIGYKQALAVLRGAISPSAALAEMQRDTRRYAKRQWTWFRRDPRISWISVSENDEYTHRNVVHLLFRRLFWY